MIAFAQRQLLRAAMPVRRIARYTETGPIPVAAAHAMDGLQTLLGVVAVTRNGVATGDVDALAAQAVHLRKARASLEHAIANAEIPPDMLGSVGV